MTLILLLVLTGCGNLALKDFIEQKAGEFAAGTILYVSADTGSDSNPGTMEKPKATIQAAIRQLADNNKTGEVRVAQGLYEVNYASGIHIILAEGISLYGGYNLTFSERDPYSYESEIADVSTVGGADDNPTRALEAGSGITGATVVDGFKIYGGGGELHGSGLFGRRITQDQHQLDLGGKRL